MRVDKHPVLGDREVGRLVTISVDGADIQAVEGEPIAAALLAQGEPAQALVQIATERRADLLVVGAIQDTSIAGRLLGTVAGDVVRKADCDVLLVRPEGLTTGAFPVPEDV